MEPIGPGSPYPHHNDCKCESCHLVFDAHNYSAIGTMLGCKCSGCLSRRINKSPWNFIPSAPRREVRKVATINMCEREGCDAMMKSNAAAQVTVYNDGEAPFAGEICPACMGELMTVLLTAPSQPRDRAYSEPWSPSINDANKSHDPLSDLTDAELAAELVTRQGFNLAKQINELEARPQDHIPGPGERTLKTRPQDAVFQPRPVSDNPQA